MMDKEMFLDAKAGNKEAIMLVIEDFEGLIIKRCRSYNLHGYSFEDLKQVCYMAVIEACKKLDEEHIETAPKYLINTICNALYNKARTVLKVPELSSLNECNEAGVEFMDLLEDDSNLELDVIYNMDKELILNAYHDLSIQEKDIISRYILNQYGGLMEYSRVYNMDYRKVRYIKDKAIEKLRKQSQIEFQD